MKKKFVQPDELRYDSMKLASKVYNDGFKPDYLVVLWRGGVTIGICVHEFLKYMGVEPDHIAIRTSRYTGIDKVSEEISVHNLGYLVERLNCDSKVLIVDDVYDSGLSVEKVITTLKEKLCCKMPTDIRVATVFYKPKRNQTGKSPQYYVHESDEWIVFPHELEGLTIEEIDEAFGGEIGKLILDTQSP